MMINGMNMNKPFRLINRYGGKGNMAHHYQPIIQEMALSQGLDVFVDFMGGAGTISLLALNLKDKEGKPMFQKVVFNDIDPCVTSIFRVAKDKQMVDELIPMLLGVTYCKGSFDYAHNKLKDIRAGKEKVDDLTMAFLSIIENRMSFNSACNSFKPYRNEYEKRKYQETFFQRALELKYAPEQLERLVVKEGSYIDLIHDNREEHLFDYNRSLLFFDPPYADFERSAKKVYHDEMGFIDHMVLIQAISYLKHVLLCGYQQGVGGHLGSIYGILDDFKDIQKLDLGAMHRPSSSKPLTEASPHEILWVKA